jgi:hypothetical protein
MVRTANFIEGPLYHNGRHHPASIPGLQPEREFHPLWGAIELILETKFVPMTGQQSVS